MARFGWWRSVGPRVAGVRKGLARHPAEPPDVGFVPEGVPGTVVAAAKVANGVTSEMITAQLTTAITLAHAELARADLKAQALLAGTSAALIIGVSALGAKGVPVVARIAGWGAVGIACVAVVLLALAIRPYLKGRFGLLRFAQKSAAEVVDVAVQVGGGGSDGFRAQAEEVRGFAVLALRKYRIVRQVLHLLGVAAVLTLVSIAITAAAGQ